MGILRTSNGKYLLVGGQFLTATPTQEVLTPTTSLSVTDYHVESPIAEPVFQRKAGTESRSDGGYADVPVLFSYAGGAPITAQARVVTEGGSVIVNWTSLTGVQVNDANKTGLGTLPTVPIGCKYLLEIRDAAQPGIAITNGIRKWGIGVCIIAAGQSNMVSTLAAGSYNEAIPGLGKGESDYWGDPSHAGVYFSISGFTTPFTAPGANYIGNLGGTIDSGSGGASSFVRLVSNGLSAKYGRKIPVCLAVWVWNGTGLGAMYPPGSNAQVYTNTGTTDTTIGWLSPKGFTPGDFEGVLLHQGEAEAGDPVANRVASLKAYYQFMLNLVAPLGRTAANLFFRPAVLGSYTQAAGIETIRAAVYQLEKDAPALGWPRVKAGWTCIDLDPEDNGDQGLHFRDVPNGNQYQKWSNRRMVQSSMLELGCASFSGMGPKITGVTLSGNVATVAVTQDGGTALVPRNSSAALSGWYANTTSDFSGTDIAVTASIVNANTISATFPAGTVFPVYMKYMGGKVGTLQSQHPDLTNPVYDNAIYPSGADSREQFTGIALQPTPESWKVGV